MNLRKHWEIALTNDIKLTKAELIKRRKLAYKLAGSSEK